MDVFLGIIAVIVVLALEILAGYVDLSFLRPLKKWEQQWGSKLMVTFLSGFIVFTVFTDKMPDEWQKIPVVIAALLLIWANLLPVKKDSQ